MEISRHIAVEAERPMLECGQHFFHIALYVEEGVLLRG
jgi:hypothetical protein